MKNASSRLYHYLLQKLDEEPIATRALLCEDLAEFLPNEALAERLREQARTLRKIERDAQVLRLSITPQTKSENPSII